MKKKYVLSEFVFPGHGRQSLQSVWVVSQMYNSALKDLWEQTQWMALFHYKDCDSFVDCLRENDVMPNWEEQQAVRGLLAEMKHSKLLLKMDQPTAYRMA